VRCRAEQRANRQQQVIRSQIAHHAARALELRELGEDKLQARLDLLVGIADDRARAGIGEARW
jgi:hypothetical protein